MSPTVATYNEFSSESTWAELWPNSHDGEANDNYALSHQGEDHAWSPNLLASSESSSAPQAIPNYDLSDHTHPSFTYGYHSQTFGGVADRSIPYELTDLAVSPSQPTHSFGSSWQDPLFTHHHSFTSGLGSGDSFGHSFNSYANLDFNASVHTTMNMTRTKSGSSQDATQTEDIGESYDGVDDSKQLGTSCTVNGIFPLEDVDSNPHGTKTKGRQRPLTLQARKDAHLMRRLGACASCKSRKIKCDPGIPCRRCVIYYQDRLIYHPCRGDQLHGIAECMIKHNTFPRGSPERFIRDGYVVHNSDYVVRFDLGFGRSAISFHCRPVVAQDHHNPKPLIHKHMSYPWPPQSDSSERKTKDELVFPAMLTDGQDLDGLVESYLQDLLSHENFLYFPLFKSDLNVLLGCYWLYKNSPTGQMEPLENALKLLILVHQGGDLRVRKDDNSLTILAQSYGSSMSAYENSVVTPCLVRSELGPVFSGIAHKLMRSILKKLETLSQIQDPAKFPLILATFSVLCMALESLQYHVSKLPYHCHLDDPRAATAMQPDVEEPPTRDLSDPGADILLRFYKGTKCHTYMTKLGTGAKTDLTFSLSSLFAPQTGTSPTAASRSRANSITSRQRSGSGSSNARRGREAAAFLDGLHNAVFNLNDYLENKAQAVVVPFHDMTAFFDRILGKMYLLDQASS